MNKLIIIIGCSVLVLILGLLLLLPKYQNIQLLKADIQEKEFEFQSKEAYFTQVKEISEELEDYGEPLFKISSAVPLDPLPSSLFNFFQITAAQTGLILKDVHLGGTVIPEDGKDSMKETKLTLQLTGFYNAFKDFLLVIESSSRMVEVESVSVEPPTKEFDDPTLFILNIKAYSR
jgi:Tfp pilus assembly protein PilO